MILSNFSIENSYLVISDPKVFFWIAASVADATAVNLNGIRTPLAKVVSTYFINGKPLLINWVNKLSDPPSWLLFFLVVLFNKIHPFSKELIILISFFRLFISIIPEPTINGQRIFWRSFISLFVILISELQKLL